MKFNKKAASGFVIGLAILSTGCSTMNRSEPIPQYKADSIPANEVYEKMAAAMESSSKSLQTLSEVRNAEVAGKLTYEEIRQANWRATYTPIGMDRVVTINWNGPSEPIIRTLGKMVDYDVQILNDASPIAHTVHINVKDEPVIDVLRKIDAQVNNLLSINIYEESKVKKIEVKYAD
jgi:defect-in-organelle-trafficking protein DotD